MRYSISLLLALLITVPEFAVPDVAEARLLRRRACRRCAACLPTEPPRSPVVESVAQGGFDSPEAAFRAYLLGVVAEDYDSQLSALTPEGRAWHIGLTVFAAVYTFGQDPEMQELLKKHGVDFASSDKKLSRELSEAESDKVMVEALLKVEEPGKLMRAVQDRYLRLAKDLKVANDQPATPTPDEQLLRVRLGRVSYPTRDTAVAPVSHEVATLEIKEVRFRKIAGRWYCDIDPR